MNRDIERPFSSVEAVRFGWRTTLGNLKPLLVLGLVGLLLALLSQTLDGPAARHSGGLRTLLSLAVQVLQVGVTMAYTRAALMLHDGRTTGRLLPGLTGHFPPT